MSLQILYVELLGETDRQDIKTPIRVRGPALESASSGQQAKS